MKNIYILVILLLSSILNAQPGHSVVVSSFASMPPCSRSGQEWTQSPDRGPLHAICDGSAWHFDAYGLHEITPPGSLTGWTASGATLTADGVQRLTAAPGDNTYRTVTMTAPPSPYFFELCLSAPFGVYATSAIMTDGTAAVSNGVVIDGGEQPSTYEQIVRWVDYINQVSPTIIKPHIGTSTESVRCYGLESDGVMRRTYKGRTPQSLALSTEEPIGTLFTTTAIGWGITNVGDPTNGKYWELVHFKKR